jgi:hypothetical protein
MRWITLGGINEIQVKRKFVVVLNSLSTKTWRGTGNGGLTP